MSENTCYITTSISYPNAKPHLGHAYEAVLADILARYHRLVGYETYFLTGTDENSQKVVQAAEKAGKDPKTFTDETVLAFKDLYMDLDISCNQFIRTSDEKKHWPGAQAFWERLMKTGDLYKDTYEGLYCVGCEAFKTEKELIDGKCPIHETKPEHIKEENYFFKLSKYTDVLKEKISSGELQIVPESRKKEILSLVDKGLEDISFSRPKKAIPWGIPVPNDPDQVIYVWADALTNYITALGFGRKNIHTFETFWPAQYHVIGKDILRFHAAIWPAMLLSADLPLPKTIFVHGFLLSDGKKMSKSLGNVIDPTGLVREYGAEAVRYYFAREVSPFEDGDVTLEKFQDAYNGNLANGIGNLTSRLLTMVEKYDIELEPSMFASREQVFERETVEEYHDAFNALRIDQAADVVWGAIAFIDAYLAETKPFKTIEEDEDRAVQDILFAAERLWEVAVLLEPFLPQTAEKIQHALTHRKVPETLFPRINK